MAVNSLLAKITLPKKLAKWTHLKPCEVKITLEMSMLCLFYRVFSEGL